MNILKKIISGVVMFAVLTNTITITYGLSEKFYTQEKYAGQWPISGGYQTVGTPNNSRDTMGMKGNFKNEIGIKTKLFTEGKSPDFYLGGIDINGDGKENLIYGYGGKLYLGDIDSGINIWETKVLDIKYILGVESILENGVKTIVALFGEDRYVGLIDGSTGELTWISNSVTGPVKKVKPGWPGFDWKKFDIDSDGINEYHFKQRYNKYHSYRFFASGSTVVGETLWSTQGYGDYNEGSDGYQVSTWSMGKISNKLVVGTKGSNNFAFYSNDVDSSLTGIDKFKMPAFGKWIVGGSAWKGWGYGLHYFYDINGDGNDEYISRIDSEVNNSKLSRVFVGGLDASGSMIQYMSVSYPATYNSSGSLINNGNFSTPFPLKNYDNLEDSYILIYGRDPVDSNNKWMMMKYKGASNTGWLKTSQENTSFNYDIVYDSFDTNTAGDPSGIFNNGQKDYIVTKKGSEYLFYTFTGTGTFLTGSTLKVGGSFFDIYDFLDTRREMNRNSGIFSPSFDSDGNGLKEFVVTNNNYFKFYEITDSGVNLVKTFGPYNEIPGVIKWGLTDDKKDMYAITYSSNTNTINYYRTNFNDGQNNFTKKTSDSFYGGGQIRDISIAKLGQGDNEYNKLMISGMGMYDARNVTPTIPPVKIGNDYFSSSFDVDGDGVNEVRIGNSAYTFNSPGNYTKKYENFGYVGDINGDGVLDKAWAWCGSTPTIPINLFFTMKDGKTGANIIPDLDWGNGNGWCLGGGEYDGVSVDVNKDGFDEIAVGVGARATRLISYNSGSQTVTQGNPVRNYSSYKLQSFDVDGDGNMEIIRGHDKSDIFKTDENNKTKLTYIASVDGGVKTTWGINLGLPSLYRVGATTYFAFRGVDGQVSLKSLSGTTITNHFNNYYLYGNSYANENEVLNNNLISMATADVFVGDFIGDGTVTVLVGGGDGGVYILGLDGSVIKYFNVGSSIKRIIIGDVNNFGFLTVFVSAENGYIYQLTNSNLQEPTWVKDGLNYGFDIQTQTDNKKVGVNFAKVSKATGYFVQLYNVTEKSQVFDWVDVGNKLKVCIRSEDVVDENCISTGKVFNLNGKSKYQWRVQSYNSNTTSSIANSNGFIVLRLEIDKKVALKENMTFEDELIVSPNTLLTYSITLFNDSLNTIGGVGYMNYDMIPAQSVASCEGISDCRTKNITITDYMPSKFIYISNSTVWIIKKVNFDGSEEVLAGGSQVSDAYFKNQQDTVLTTNPGETLIWQFPENVAIPPGAILELQFDAIARQ